MFRNFPFYACLFLVYGAVVTISSPKDVSKPSLDRFRRQTTSEENDSTLLWTNNFLSAFNTSLPQILSSLKPGLNITQANITSFKVVIRKTEKLPDGTVKTEELIRNSGADEDGTGSHKEIFPAGTDISGFLDSGFTTDIFDQIKKKKFCPPLKSPNANVKCVFENDEVSCDSPMKPGTVATAQCYQYYKPALQQQKSQVTCLNNGLWNNPLVYCIPVCGNSKEIGTLSPLVVDGKDANVGNFPWHAGIYYRQMEHGQEFWVQKCGGSLISDKFVLTAAHCVVNNEEKDVRIALGKFFRSWGQIEETEQKRNVAKIIFPQDFHRPTLYFDIALLLMDSKIKLGEYVMPVCSSVLDGSNTILNKQLYIVGWGQTVNGVGGASSPSLQYNDVSFVPPNTCQRMIPITYSLFDKFCTIKNESGVSIAQQGDSGGGLTAVVKGLHYIFGIVSGKLNHVTTFTNVTWPTHIWWIENEMRKYDSSFRVIES